MQNKRWILYPIKSDDIVDQLLINRGIDPKYKDQFLNPEFYSGTFGVKNFPGISTAVKRIKKSMENKEKIGVFADYDADGVPGAAILKKLFELLKIKSEIYIPTRAEGYGLNETGIRYFKEKGCSLMVTVDLGIVNCDEVKLAKDLGIDVIITDHHEIQKDKLPLDALAIVHPRLDKSKYPNPYLSGGAVAWKLAWACLKDIKGEKYLTYAKWWLDLAALTLVCDNMVVTGDGNNLENRVLIKYGINILSKTKNIGLKKLYDIASIDPKSINTYTIGFQIGPRINAPGRMDHAGPSYYLLVSEDHIEAQEIAKKLDQLNSSRQNELNKVLKKSKEIVKRKQLDKKKIILISGKNWNSGIVGLVAGKLMEEYTRPVIVCREDDKVLHGSARSIAEFDIMSVLKECEQLLLGFGGHKMAAGLTFRKENFDKLYSKLERIANKKIKDEYLEPKIKIDARINSDMINYKLYNVLNKFEPFGIGNPRPLFLLKNVEILSMRSVGKEDRHLKIKVSQASNVSEVSRRQKYEFDAIGFGMGEWKNKLQQKDLIDIVFVLDENVWNGSRKLQLKIVDIKSQ